MTSAPGASSVEIQGVHADPKKESGLSPRHGVFEKLLCQVQVDPEPSLLDAVCLIGSVERCRERLAAFGAAGLDLPILVPPIGVDGSRVVVKAFRQ